MTVVSLRLDVTLPPVGGGPWLYRLYDDEGLIAESEYSSMLLYVYELEGMERGLCRRLRATPASPMVWPEMDNHDRFRAEYFHRMGIERVIVRRKPIPATTEAEIQSADELLSQLGLA